MHLKITVRHEYPWRLIRELKKMSIAIEYLRQEVAESKAGVESAIALIGGLRDRLDEMVDSTASLEELQAEVNALSAELSDNTDSLAAAVAAPPAPEPAPSEEPV